MHSLSSSYLTRFVAPLAMALILLPAFAFAQTGVAPVPMPAAEGEAVESVVIANVNLGEATLVEQSAERLLLSFLLSNGDTVPQFDIRYGVELLRVQEDGSQSVVDSFVSPEVLTLSPNQVLSKTVEYPMAAVAPGTYTIWITAQTAGGVMLGLGRAGEVTVASADVLEIKADSCVLTVVGEEAGVTYDLYQGVDVASTEEVVLNCTVQNHGTIARTVTPQYETFVRTIFGDKFAMNYPAVTPLVFAAGEEKSVALTIPKAAIPQAYDVALTFIDTTTRAAISNKLVAHYVIQGVSATIQTVDFTKESYQTGEEIVLDLFWTGSADSFPDSRQGQGTDMGGVVSASVSIVDGDGLVCAPALTQVLSDSMTTLRAVATANCVAPAAMVTLLSPDGTVLDTSSIAVPKAEPVAETPVAPIESKNNTLMYVTILALTIALITILFVATRHKKEVVVEEVAKTE